MHIAFQFENIDYHIVFAWHILNVVDLFAW